MRFAFEGDFDDIARLKLGVFFRDELLSTVLTLSNDVDLWLGALSADQLRPDARELKLLPDALQLCWIEIKLHGRILQLPKQVDIALVIDLFQLFSRDHPAAA